MSLFTKTGLVPNWAGEFTSYQQWVNKGASWLKSPDHRRAVCIDDKGRRVTCGGDFALARDEGAFPVRFFWDYEPQTLAAPSVASAANGDELPPLPDDPAGCCETVIGKTEIQPGIFAEDIEVEDGCSAEQMRDYARAAVLAEREAIADMVHEASIGTYTLGQMARMQQLAVRIRARN